MTDPEQISRAPAKLLRASLQKCIPDGIFSLTSTQACTQIHIVIVELIQFWHIESQGKFFTLRTEQSKGQTDSESRRCIYIKVNKSTHALGNSSPTRSGISCPHLILDPLPTWIFGVLYELISSPWTLACLELELVPLKAWELALELVDYELAIQEA
jgi:hypothetical protein